MDSKHITSILKEGRIFYPQTEFVSKARIKSLEEYSLLYQRSLENPEKFWGELAEQLHWLKKWDCVFKEEQGNVQWFTGGMLNVAENCLDRHVHSWRKNKAALIWESEQGEVKTFTYQQLLLDVARFANVLMMQGVKKGDRVCIYLPMIPELVVSLLACARIGAVHSVVFGGFSSESLKDRILDSEAKLLITADGGWRNGKIIPLKQYADAAVEACSCIEKVIVVKRTCQEVGWDDARDVWWHALMKDSPAANVPEQMDAEDPLFILYTSGTTGKPKGILHTQAGYLLYAMQTFQWVFDIQDEDVYFCTADIGWITGHSYVVYGPLANGATIVMYEGGPIYPQPDRFWKIVEKHKVSIFYTAPTAIRMLIKEGDSWPEHCDLSSLRLLGSVGEPINPEAWMWYYKVIGKEKCPIVDTWWQTETGGIMISALPGATPLKPGSATLPLPGIFPAIVKEDGIQADRGEGGNLVITKPWPGMFRTLWKNPGHYQEHYFSRFPGLYLTGDGAKQDEHGYYWIMGRVDDVIKVAGHGIGSAEVESALVSYEGVAEAAVVAYPHEIKGWGVYAFVALKNGVVRDELLKSRLVEHVAKKIGPIARPEKIQFVDELPKTRSGKIMRRILKAIASGNQDYGNITTLTDPGVVEKLAGERV